MAGESNVIERTEVPNKSQSTGTSERLLDDAQPTLTKQCQFVATDMKENLGLPGWVPPTGPTDQVDFINRAMQVKQIDKEVQRYGQIMDLLNRSSGPLHFEGLSDLPNNWKKIQDDKGRTSIKPTLPIDASPTMDNLNRMHTVANWLNKYAQAIDQSMTVIKDKPLDYGDRAERGVTPDGKSFDLVTYKYNAQWSNRGSDWTVKVVSEANYQQRGWYSYNNWLTNSVGKVEDTRYFGRDALIPIKNILGDTELIQAKELVPPDGRFTVGPLSKAAGLLADVGMLTVGIVAGRAAWNAGFKAMAAWNFLNAGLAGAGFFEPMMSPEMNHARQLAMIPGMITAAAPGIIRWGATRGAAATAELAPALSTYCLSALKAENVVEAALTTSTLAGIGQRSMQASLAWMIPKESYDIAYMANRMHNGGYSADLLQKAYKLHGGENVRVPVYDDSWRQKSAAETKP